MCLNCFLFEFGCTHISAFFIVSELQMILESMYICIVAPFKSDASIYHSYQATNKDHNFYILIALKKCHSEHLSRSLKISTNIPALNEFL